MCTLLSDLIYHYYCVVYKSVIITWGVVALQLLLKYKTEHDATQVLHIGSVMRHATQFSSSMTVQDYMMPVVSMFTHI